ncbi:MAG TPA: YigZ family protein, partial [Porphyromonadaceae bacterium]|nr:YigZ family protein [Porphyromonadaceae bacterium]
MVENDVERGIYHTLLEPCKGVYKEKMSKFLSFVLPVESKEDIKEQLNFFHKEYHDARHICYAYILGADSSQSYSTDDGEPSGTAGKPILTQLYSTGITNIF